MDECSTLSSTAFFPRTQRSPKKNYPRARGNTVFCVSLMRYQIVAVIAPRSGVFFAGRHLKRTSQPAFDIGTSGRSRKRSFCAPTVANRTDGRCAVSYDASHRDIVTSSQEHSRPGEGNFLSILRLLYVAEFPAGRPPSLALYCSQPSKKSIFS